MEGIRLHQDTKSFSSRGVEEDAREEKGALGVVVNLQRHKFCVSTSKSVQCVLNKLNHVCIMVNHSRPMRHAHMGPSQLIEGKRGSLLHKRSRRVESAERVGLTLHGHVAVRHDSG